MATSVQLFEHLFPKTYLQEVVLVETNKNLGKEEKPITYGELLRFLGLWFEMATTHFENRWDFWCTKNPSTATLEHPGG